MLLVSFALLLLTCFLCSMLVMGGGARQSVLERRLLAMQTEVQEPGAKQTNLTLAEQAGRRSWAMVERRLDSSGIAVRLRTLALQAGSNLTLYQTLSRVAAASGSAVMTALLFLRSFPLALLVGAAAGAGPILLLSFKRKKRVARFEATLPDAIDLMARSLRAGHSVSGAIEIVADRCPEPLKGEFAQVCRQQRLGVMFRESLLDLSARVPSHDLRFLVTGMLVQRESGGDLTQILDSIGRVIADRLRINGLVRVHSAQGRFTGWILSALPFFLLLLMSVLNPGYAGILIHDPRGRELLWAGGVLIAIGMVAIRKIVAVKL